MSLREELEKAVKGPYASPGDAERAARAAAALAAYLRADEVAERVLGDDQRTLQTGSEEAFDSMTLHAAAERVLEEAGAPLHVKELGKRIKAHGWRHRRQVTRPDQINYQLAARLPRHPDVFVRMAPNTFGLVSWGTGGSARSTIKPRVALFRGPGGATGASLGEQADEVAESAWRSS
jgi:hypothetical protein